MPSNVPEDKGGGSLTCLEKGEEREQRAPVLTCLVTCPGREPVGSLGLVLEGTSREPRGRPVGSLQGNSRLLSSAYRRPLRSRPTLRDKAEATKMWVLFGRLKGALTLF